jgi:hypothetical protein
MKLRIYHLLFFILVAVTTPRLAAMLSKIAKFNKLVSALNKAPKFFNINTSKLKNITEKPEFKFNVKIGTQNITNFSSLIETFKTERENTLEVLKDFDKKSVTKNIVNDIRLNIKKIQEAHKKQAELSKKELETAQKIDQKKVQKLEELNNKILEKEKEITTLKQDTEKNTSKLNNLLEEQIKKFEEFKKNAETTAQEQYQKGKSEAENIATEQTETASKEAIEKFKQNELPKLVTKAETEVAEKYISQLKKATETGQQIPKLVRTAKDKTIKNMNEHYKPIIKNFENNELKLKEELAYLNDLSQKKFDALKLEHEQELETEKKRLEQLDLERAKLAQELKKEFEKYKDLEKITKKFKNEFELQEKQLKNERTKRERAEEHIKNLKKNQEKIKQPTDLNPEGEIPEFNAPLKPLETEFAQGKKPLFPLFPPELTTETPEESEKIVQSPSTPKPGTKTGSRKRTKQIPKTISQTTRPVPKRASQLTLPPETLPITTKPSSEGLSKQETSRTSESPKKVSTTPGVSPNIGTTGTSGRSGFESSPYTPSYEQNVGVHGEAPFYPGFPSDWTPGYEPSSYEEGREEAEQGEPEIIEKKKILPILEKVGRNKSLLELELEEFLEKMNRKTRKKIQQGYEQIVGEQESSVE